MHGRLGRLPGATDHDGRKNSPYSREMGAEGRRSVATTDSEGARSKPRVSALQRLGVRSADSSKPSVLDRLGQVGSKPEHSSTSEGVLGRLGERMQHADQSVAGPGENVQRKMRSLKFLERKEQSTTGLNQFTEFDYDVKGLSEFSSFGIKVVMRTKNSAMPPRLKDLRIIALAN